MTDSPPLDPHTLWRPVFDQIRKLWAAVDKTPKLKFATVIGLSPLTIHIDGEFDEDHNPVTTTPRSMVDGLTIGVRVLCMELHSRVTVLVAASQSQWVPGDIIPWPGATIREGGWAWCDGGESSRTADAALFAVIGTTYGAGNGTTTFNRPDFRGRVPVGFDSGDADFNVLGKTGGAKTHALTTAEGPPHTHSIPNVTSPSGGAGATLESWGGGTGSRVLNTGSSGSGTPHNNMQPYMVVNFIIKR